MTKNFACKNTSGVLLVFVYFLICGFAPADLNRIRNLVEAFKKDDRGPYQAIRWFCPDGTTLAPHQRCPRPGGIQHALHKDVVQKLVKENGIYLGQILAGTPFDDFLDADHQNSRMKQYQMERYLQAVDDGWILRRARYYRGAIQSEDEERWGLDFLKRLMAKTDMVSSQFLLLRQISKDIPHKANDDRWTFIRALAKKIAEAFPPFTNLRAKLHGQPDTEDIKRVKDFYARNRQKIPGDVEEMIRSLIKELELAYGPSHLRSLNQYVDRMPASSPIQDQLLKLIHSYGEVNPGSEGAAALLSQRLKAMADLAWSIRKELLAAQPAGARLAMIDLSNELEGVFFRETGSWHPETIEGLLEKNYALAKAVAGCGFLEVWEWEKVEPILRPPKDVKHLTTEAFMQKVDYSRRVLEWGTGMVRAIYDPVVKLFSGFEPLAGGFIDDRIRSSPLLPLGDVSGQLSDLEARLRGASNDVMGIKNQNQIRGLNPGFAFGELKVITDPAEEVSFVVDKIYVLLQAPADMKPVAGIATVSEGNLVSHVQLLARNLGIPNAVITQQNLRDLMPFSGERVFYAVSPRGAVLIKRAVRMTAEEKALVEVRQKREEKIAVPVNRVNLKEVNLIGLGNLKASDSGKLCGPKAANLGQLKNLFPERVVQGIAIPFGIFRQHLDQQMPETGLSYWQFLHQTFVGAAKDRKSGKGESDVENSVLVRLAQLRDSIKRIPFLPDFSERLQAAFRNEFGVDMGAVPVFIRSDTNMEDLKDFTGAGLNLTVFNVLEKDEILQAILDVWASPFTERSSRWRQKNLLNPENVYPSILILPSVNVDKSGVMITTGVTTGNPAEVTIAFSLGAGGAVEGQAAESYLLRENGEHLLFSPSRETSYTVLPVTGGTAKMYAHFDRAILSPIELNKLLEMAEEIKRKLAGTPGIETKGPFDVELGFKEGTIWLFQVRPYVENKKARSSTYLQKLESDLPKNVRVPLDEKILVTS